MFFHIAQFTSVGSMSALEDRCRPYMKFKSNLPVFLRRCQVLGWHCGRCEDDSLMGCCATKSRTSLPTFRRSVLLPPSWRLVALVTEARRTTEKSISMHETTRHDMPESCHFHTQTLCRNVSYGTERRSHLKKHKAGRTSCTVQCVCVAFNIARMFVSVAN